MSNQLREPPPRASGSTSFIQSLATASPADSLWQSTCLFIAQSEARKPHAPRKRRDSEKTMKRHVFMALAMAWMLHAGEPESAATDVDTAAKDIGHATAKATTDAAQGTAEAAKKTDATGHAVSKTGRSIEKGAGKTGGQGEISKLLHAIHHAGAQVGRQFDPSASYSRGMAVPSICVPEPGKNCR
jgi:hypothetical protein